MTRSLMMAAGLLLCSSLTACDVTYTGNNAQSQAGNGVGQAAEMAGANQVSADPQRDAREQFNPESERRARELALRFGGEQQRMQARQQAQREMQDVRFVVDISDRKLRVYRGDQVTATHDVAVGTQEWPTPTGEWEFHRVDINPEWNPPKDEEWAKDEEAQAPGSPDNPMGRARLVYRMPNTVHGTDDLQSLGKASSHGSIRVANDVVLQLAELLLKAGGSWDGAQWFRQMTQNRSEEYQVPLEQRIPIKVQE